MALADFKNSIVTKDQFSQTFNKFDSMVQSSARGLDKLGGMLSSGLGGTVAGLAGAAGVAAIGKMAFELDNLGAQSLTTAFELGNLGAQSLVTRQSFESVVTSVGKSTALLGELKSAAGGTIEELRLMQLANTALAGASGETGAAFAELLPKLIEGARAANKLNPALGDTEFLFQSLVTGIKRGSPLLIDNTGITLSIADANQRLADSLGKSVTALTEEEKQLALMQETARGVDRIMQQAGGTLDTMATSGDKLKVAFQELKVAIGEALAPTTSNIQTTLATAMEGLTAYLDNDIIAEHTNRLKLAQQQLADYTGWIGKNASAEAWRQQMVANATAVIKEEEEAIRRLKSASESGIMTKQEEEARRLVGVTVEAAGMMTKQEQEARRLAGAMDVAGEATATFSGKASRMSAMLGGVVAMLRKTADEAINASAALAERSVGQITGGLLGATDVVSMDAYKSNMGAVTTAVNVLTAALNNGLITNEEYDYRVADLTRKNNDWIASLRTATTAVGGLGTSLENLPDIRGKIASAMQPTFDLSSLTGGALGGLGGDTFDEAYKRLAAVALRPEELQIHAGDWGDTFAKAGLTGLSPEEAQQRARELVEAYSKGLDFSLIDRDAIKDSVRQAIKADELYNSIVDEIYAEMGKEKPKLAQAGKNMGKQFNKAMTNEVTTGAREYVGAWVNVLVPEIITEIGNRNRRAGVSAS